MATSSCSSATSGRIFAAELMTLTQYEKRLTKRDGKPPLYTSPDHLVTEAVIPDAAAAG